MSPMSAVSTESPLVVCVTSGRGVSACLCRRLTEAVPTDCLCPLGAASQPRVNTWVPALTDAGRPPPPSAAVGGGMAPCQPPPPSLAHGSGCADRGRTGPRAGASSGLASRSMGHPGRITGTAYDAESFRHIAVR